MNAILVAAAVLARHEAIFRNWAPAGPVSAVRPTIEVCRRSLGLTRLIRPLSAVYHPQTRTESSPNRFWLTAVRKKQGRTAAPPPSVMPHIALIILIVQVPHDDRKHLRLARLPAHQGQVGQGDVLGDRLA